MLEHGGRLRRAAAEFAIPLAEWLDLSTGINPQPCPIPEIPASAWHRLPEDNDGLELAAAQYYGNDQLLPVAGSQPAIQQLPMLIGGERVTMATTTYAEHPHAWRMRQLQRVDASPQAIDAAIDTTDVLVVVNPNNPTGTRYPRNTLLDWHSRLSRRRGWLVIDEAFIDDEPSNSLVGDCGSEGLVVLRSVGKFFGLAGARAGFVFGPQAMRTALAERLGPWTLSGPARFVTQSALRDLHWQAQARTRLQVAGARLETLLHRAGFQQARGPALFKWFEHPDARTIYTALAQRGILARLFDSPSSLRFGLPPDEAGWQRLEQALNSPGIMEVAK